jgi:hypothetical protein
MSAGLINAIKLVKKVKELRKSIEAVKTASEEGIQKTSESTKEALVNEIKKVQDFSTRKAKRAKRDVLKVKSNLNDAQKGFTSMLSHLSKLESNLSNLNGELDLSNDEKARLEDEINKLIKDVESLRSTHGGIIASSQSMSEVLDKIVDKCEHLEKCIKKIPSPVEITPQIVKDNLIKVKEEKWLDAKVIKNLEEYTGDKSSTIIETKAFRNLKDTPKSYSGQAGKFIAVKSSEEGLEFTEVDTDISPLTEDLDFAGFKAVAMACDSGSIFPTSPAPTTGQWFLHAPTGRQILYQYNGTSWVPIISLGSITTYVDKTDGTDAIDKGFGTDTNAYKTIQYAINQIPSLYSGNVTITCSAESYAEAVVLRGKIPAGNFSFTLQGTLPSPTVSATSTSAASASNSAQATVTVTGAGWVASAYKTMLIKFTSGTQNGQYFIIDDNTTDTLTLAGNASGLAAGVTFEIYDFGTTTTSITASAGIRGVVVDKMATTSTLLVDEGANILVNNCRNNGNGSPVTVQAQSTLTWRRSTSVGAGNTASGLVVSLSAYLLIAQSRIESTSGPALAAPRNGVSNIGQGYVLYSPVSGISAFNGAFINALGITGLGQGWVKNTPIAVDCGQGSVVVNTSFINRTGVTTFIRNDKFTEAYAQGYTDFDITLPSGGIGKITNATAANVPWTVKGAASQSASLQEWQDSSGVVLAKIASNGKTVLQPTIASDYALSVENQSGATGGGVFIQSQDGNGAKLLEIQNLINSPIFQVRGQGGGFGTGQVLVPGSLAVGTSNAAELKLDLHDTSGLYFQGINSNNPHGMTTWMNTNGNFKLYQSAAGGGIHLIGATRSDGSGSVTSRALYLSGFIGQASPTAPAVVINGAKKDGTTVQALASGEIVAEVENGIPRSGSVLTTWYGGSLVFNEPGNNYDVRIEGDTDANLFVTDASTDRVGIGTNAPGSKLDVAGSLQVDSITNDTGLAHGTYTPTRSAEANLDANVTMSEAQYMRVGNTVTISGRFTADPTLTATTTSFEFTLPISSNLGAAEDVAGVAFCGAIAGMGAEIIGVVANDTAKVQWVSTDVTSQTWSYTLTYTII